MLKFDVDEAKPSTPLRQRGKEREKYSKTTILLLGVYLLGFFVLIFLKFKTCVLYTLGSVCAMK